MQDLNPADFLILVVDDNAVNLQFISLVLERSGYQVIVAKSGSDALKVMDNCLPDLILLDILMPEMDGYTVCRKIKSTPYLSHIPIIFLSALDAIFDKIKAFDSGGVDYISKPFQSQEVIARINNQLRIQVLQRELQQKNKHLQDQIIATQKAEAELRAQKESTDRLLLNILPVPIAQRLKQQEGIIADSFGDVSVLFADLVGFTSLSATQESTELVSLLNQIFSSFDDLTEKYNLEKIKTIGDAYMVVGGLPLYHPDHAIGVAKMALEMQQLITQFFWKTSAGLDSDPIHLRIGIHLGAVTAGVIGKKKFIYDLWGDTVNVASRMESSGYPDTIQVTETVYERLQDQFIFEQRGLVSIKGKGEMMTYFLTGEK
jgi:adenylate cyclase